MLRWTRYLALALFLLAGPARAEWYRATSPHFEIYAEGDEAEIRLRVDRLERLDGALRRIGGIDPALPSRPLAIYFLDDVAAVERALGRRGTGAAGFYAPRAGGSLAVAPNLTPWRGAGAMTPDSILFHEYSHHFLLQNFSAAYPPWFVEGFAEFYATTRFGADGSVIVGAIPQFRVASLRAATDITAEDLLVTGSLDLRSHRLEQFYSRSWLLVHYLTFGEARAGQRARYVSAIEQGVPLREAARQAFGDLPRLNRELRLYIDSPIRTATLSASALTVPAFRVERLRAGEVALIPLTIEYMRGVSAERAPGFLAEVRSIQADHPGEPQALFLLAEAEGMAGNHAASDRAADALLALEPDHGRALLRKARNLEANAGEGGRRAARPLIVRANRANPRDPLPLIAYYRSFGPGEQVPALALDGMRLAVQLAPQSSDVRLLAASALVKAGHHAEAATVLRPAAFAPHGGGAAERAQALLGLIEASAGSLAPELVRAADSILAEIAL